MIVPEQVLIHLSRSEQNEYAMLRGILENIGYGNETMTDRVLALLGKNRDIQSKIDIEREETNLKRLQLEVEKRRVQTMEAVREKIRRIKETTK